MYQPQFILLLIVLIKILVYRELEVAAELASDLSTQLPPSQSATTTTTTAASAYRVVPPVELTFQPALIGFRCEGENEQTLDGISVVEANTAVRITLFGEAFTTDTIVAFTTEFVRETDVVDQVISSNNYLQELESRGAEQAALGRAYAEEFSSGAPKNRLAPNWSSSSLTNSGKDYSTQEAVAEPLVGASTKENRSIERQESSVAGKKKEARVGAAATAGVRSKKYKRRLLTRRHDCTDYDRVISYKLTEDNLVTPNVAVLTIRLPELDQSSSGKYYYFCIKQPAFPSNRALPADQQQQQQSPSLPTPWLNQRHPNPAGASSGGLNSTLSRNGLNSSTKIGNNYEASGKLVWVHQGDEWWLTLRAEPPILSVANDCVLIVLLLFLSAVTSGLNLGLMSLDMNELAVIGSCGDQRERSYARTIAPLRKRGNYLLCSLLLGNVMVNSTLTVILEEMTSGVVAVIGSTLAIVVLGEIVPQAFCARKGLAIGAKTIYLTYAFMIITFPLSYPISCLLDCVLGEEKGNVYDRERLMEFIRITGNHTQLEADEVAIISGALKLKKIKVDQIMTRIEDVFMLPLDCMLNRDTIKSIIEKGYSRIPIYEFNDRKQIVALILAKDLALVDPDDQVPLANMLMYCKHPLIFIDDSATLDVALNEFKTGKSHMAIVRHLYDDGEVDKYYEAIGVVTLEDVIEEVLQTEINDETDTLSDNRRKRRRTEAQVAHLVDNLAQQHPALTGPNSTKF